MVPVKLKMQAFESYAEAAEIDFEKLDGLFLISGETGAGKTAVLDAMTYALYGESSGRDREEMRCVLPAAAELPTEVEFRFRVRGRLYKFTRSIVITPRSKNLEQRQDCFWYDEEEQAFRAFFENPKKASVKAKAEEIIGLSAEQFRQVVILPQGKFERLLTSDSADKEAMLSTLFGAEKYTRLSDRLSEKADAMRKELAAERTVLKAMLAAENAESFESLSEEKQRLEEKTGSLVPRLEAAKKELSDARERCTAAELLAAKFSELDKAEKRLGELKGREEETAALRVTLKKHENASRAVPEQGALDGAAKELTVRRAALDAARKACSEAEEKYSEAAERLERVMEKADAGRADAEELAVLERLAPLYEKIAVSESALKEAEARREEREKALADASEKLENIRAETERLSVLREKITAEHSRRLPELSERKAALERGAEADKRLKKYTAALDVILKNAAMLEEEANRLEEEKNAAEEEYDRLYAEYLSNTAAELSSGLKEGVPCPVCGSIVHPAPACGSGSSVTAERVKAARDEFERLTKEFSGAHLAAAAERGRVPDAEYYIEAERKTVESTGYTREELEKVSARYAEAERQNGRLPDIDKGIAELRTRAGELEKREKAERDKIAGIKDSEARAGAELSSLREQLDPRFGDAASYSEGVAALRKKAEEFRKEKESAEKERSGAEKRNIEAAAALKQAESEWEGAGKKYAAAEEAFREKLAELGISEEEYKNSILPEERAAAAAAGIKGFDMEMHSASERAESLRRELEGKAPPPLQELREEADAAEAALTGLTGEYALADDRLKHLRKISKEYSDRFSALEARGESSDKLTAFARFMHGDRGISFTRYVLSIMLGLVTAEANRILADIHGGRFRLRVKTEIGANSKQGLDLEVETRTDGAAAAYGVKNLSGGEKFLISLALSLGLSAVARSRSGGIGIEAMFIDEGFGSLDSASLKEAVSILCGLTLDRTTIGIISHVEELKNVIPRGIRVSKGKDGASAIAPD